MQEPLLQTVFFLNRLNTLKRGIKDNLLHCINFVFGTKSNEWSQPVVRVMSTRALQCIAAQHT